MYYVKGTTNDAKSFPGQCSERSKPTYTPLTISAFQMSQPSIREDLCIGTMSVSIWGKEKHMIIRQVERASLKVIMLCRLLIDTVIGPYFFEEDIVSQNQFYHTLQEKAIPKLQARHPNVIFFQIDGAPGTSPLETQSKGDISCRVRWIAKDGPMPWHARSLDSTALDFLWGI